MAEDKNRLIYANDVEFALQAICDRESGVPLITAEWLASVVRKAPTVYAVEVVHGRWKEPYRQYVVCSECGSGYVKYEFIESANYCPNCGAKMDGDPK